MPVTVANRTLVDDENGVVLSLSARLGGSEETAALKADASSFLYAGPNGPHLLAIKKVKWSIYFVGQVRVLWDATDPSTALLLTGHGEYDFTKSPLGNDAGAGVTGDILFSTEQTAGDAGYLVLLELEKRSGYTLSPQITAIAFTDAHGGAYVTDDDIELTATFNQAVFIDPRNPPVISIDLGSGPVNAIYASGDGTNQLVFRYTVLVSDTAEAGQFDVATDALSGTLRGTLIGQLSVTNPAVPASDTAAFTVNPA